MPSEKEKLTLHGLIDTILQPNPNIRDSNSRQQAYLTTLASLLIAAICFVAGIVGLIVGFPASLTIGLILLTISMSVACAMGRTENFLVGSILLVSGIILGGFLISSAFPENISVIIILMATIVPAFSLSIVLLPLLAIIIIAVVVLITIGVLPLMATISASTELWIFIVLTIIQGIFILVAWYRDTTESLQQDEIGSLRGRLEERIEERTRYSRIVAEISQELTSLKTMDDLLNQAASQITSRLGFSYVGIFIANETGNNASLKAAQGAGAEKILRTGKRVTFGPSTLLGWVAENKRQRVASRIDADSMLLETELLPENQSEIGIPILSRDQLLGLMDLQSTRSTVFDNETIVVLEMLSAQIASAIQNVRRTEVEQGSTHEVTEVYLAGNKINQAKTDDEIYHILQELFSKFPYVNLFLAPEGEGLKVIAKTDSQLPEGQSLPEFISVSLHELEPFIAADIFIGEKNRLNSLPYNLVSTLRQLQIFSIAIIPVIRNGSISGAFIIGSREKIPLALENLQPYLNLVKQVGTSMDRIQSMEETDSRILDMEANTSLSSEIAKAKTEKDVLEAVQNMFQGTSKASILLVRENDTLRIVTSLNLPKEGKTLELPQKLNATPGEILLQLGNTTTVEDVSKLSALYYAQFHPELQQFIKADAEEIPTLHPELIKLINSANFTSVALIPVMQKDELDSLIIVGTESNQSLSPLVKTFSVMTELVLSAFTRFRSERDFELRLNKDNARLTEEAQIRAIQFQVASEIAEAKTDDEVFKAIQGFFQGTPGVAILLISEKNNLRVVTSLDLVQKNGLEGLPEWLNISPNEIFNQLGNNVLVEEVSKLSAMHYAQFHPELQKFIEDEAKRLPTLNIELIKFFENVQFSNVALMPIICNKELAYLIIVGSRDNQPISSLVISNDDVNKLITSGFARIRDEREVEHRLNEDEAIILMSQEITSIRDLPTLYRTLHAHIRQTLGNVNFLVTLFDENTNSISVPYMFEEGAGNEDAVDKIETFPVGEGLTSVLIRTKQPLMLVEDTEKRALALGAKIAGKPAKSWLGTPMVIADKVIGTIVVQDTEHEFAFNENDLRFITTLSTQIAGTIFNARLLEETQNRAIQLKTAAEIARDISGSLNVGELITKAVNLIRERFNYYHAAIFLIDSTNEFAVIREATGEAGNQMKRAGHKLKVGSKSIVGYATGNGEPLIVNDTNRDATYYANPLLPETRAEVAIPLNVGQRILGALDVQSTQPYSFSDEDVSVLRILSDQMAIAIINSELFADVQEHLSQHRLLHHVTTAAASGTTLEESLTSATQGLQVTLGGDRVSILLADKAKKILKVRAFAGYSEEVGKLEIPFGEGITGWVAVHQQPQRISDVTQDSRYIQVGSNIRSELAIPLSYRGDLLGVLNVESDQANAYNENDEEMLGTLGGSLAAIISNARLIEQVRRQVDHERMLYEVTSKIRRSTDMQTIMATTAGELSKVLGARRAQIKMGSVEAGPESGKSSDQTVSSPGDSV